MADQVKLETFIDLTYVEDNMCSSQLHEVTISASNIAGIETCNAEDHLDPLPELSERDTGHALVSLFKEVSGWSDLQVIETKAEVKQKVENAQIALMQKINTSLNL